MPQHGHGVALLSKDDEQWIRAAHAQAEQASKTWALNGTAITKSYGGRWIALVAGQIVADSVSPAGLRTKLDAMGEAATHAVLRFVTPEDWEFALPGAIARASGR